MARPITQQTLNFQEFQKQFNRCYNEWYQCNAISENLRKQVEGVEITIDMFEALTRNRELQRYIALVDGKIRFDELP